MRSGLSGQSVAAIFPVKGFPSARQTANIYGTRRAVDHLKRDPIEKIARKKGKWMLQVHISATGISGRSARQRDSLF
jgi:hypothetical protein